MSATSNIDPPGGSISVIPFAAPWLLAAPHARELKWAALLDGAAMIAQLARLPSPAWSAELRDLPARARALGGWRQSLAEQTIDDLAAVMQPGLAALVAVRSSGRDCSGAALALWHECDSAQAALLALIAPPSA